MSSNKTLHYDTFLSHIFHTLIINVSVDPSRAIISFIDISTAHSYNWKLDDEENWVHKFDWQSSATQASTVPLIALQSSDAPKSSHEAYPTLLAPPSLRTTCLQRRSMGCRCKSMHALMH
ncbi:hypothetical protein GOBAR_DD05639 [Gossypium barbadense]|nr:hypothetical protein GOBAR_DD05639 [Gossypium barbadense]